MPAGLAVSDPGLRLPTCDLSIQPRSDQQVFIFVCYSFCLFLIPMESWATFWGLRRWGLRHKEFTIRCTMYTYLNATIFTCRSAATSLDILVCPILGGHNLCTMIHQRAQDLAGWLPYQQNRRSQSVNKTSRASADSQELSV